MELLVWGHILEQEGKGTIYMKWGIKEVIKGKKS